MHRTLKPQPQILAMASLLVLAPVAAYSKSGHKTAQDPQTIFNLSLPTLEPASEKHAPAPCAVLTAGMGIVRIFDASRTHIIEAKPSTGLPCGAWISTENGWAALRHQDGPTLHLGPRSFAQLASPTHDDLILYRGQLYVDTGNGNPEFRIVSEVGRARIKNGKGIFISNSTEDETELIQLAGTGTLENRFQPTSQTTLQPGEASFLYFKLMRINPSVPNGISIASLKPRLEDLQVPEAVQAAAIHSALSRTQKNYLEPEGKEAETKKTKREIASVPADLPPSKPQALEAHLLEKVTGGAPVSRNILFPDKFYGKSQKIRVEPVQPEMNPKFKKRLNKEDEMEKKRLMTELSKIHVD